jgi:hypothetical protein
MPKRDFLRLRVKVRDRSIARWELMSSMTTEAHHHAKQSSYS